MRLNHDSRNFCIGLMIKLQETSVSRLSNRTNNNLCSLAFAPESKEKFHYSSLCHKLLMVQSCCQQERRRLTDTRRSVGRNMRPFLTATRLPFAIFTVSILLMCTNWMLFNHLQIPSDDEIIHDEHESFVPPFRSQNMVVVQNHTSVDSSAINDKADADNADPREIQGDLPPLKTNHTLSKSFLKLIDWKSKMPETKEHLTSLSADVDVEDLGMYLSNKSAYVYNPGTILARDTREDISVPFDSICLVCFLSRAISNSNALSSFQGFGMEQESSLKISSWSSSLNQRSHVQSSNNFSVG